MTTVQQDYLRKEAKAFTDVNRHIIQPEIEFIDKSRCVRFNLLYKKSDAVYLDISLTKKYDTECILFMLLYELSKRANQNRFSSKDDDRNPSLRKNFLAQYLEVESDLLLVQYLNQRYRLRSFREYLAIVFRSKLEFGSEVMSHARLDHLVGSVISVEHFLRTGQRRFCLPFISEELIELLTIESENKKIAQKKFILGISEADRWGSMFQNLLLMKEKDFVKTIESLTTSFLLRAQKAAGI